MTELAKVVEDLGRAFNAFQSANDERLAQIESKGRATSDIEAKVDAINAEISALTGLKDRLDGIEAAANRGTFGGGGAGATAIETARAEHAQGFDAFFRNGVDAGLRDLEVRAELSTQSDPDGGFLVTPEIDTEISRVLGTVSAMRNLARVRTVGSSVYKKIVNVGGTTSGWVGETQSRDETGTPRLEALEFPVMELYASPQATQGMLDDASFDIGAWLADEVSTEFAEQEGAAFITGNGVAKPRGILSYTSVANSSYSWGNVGYIASGAAGAFAASNPSDALIDLQHALKSGYRAGASWLMNDLTLAAIRKFKDGDGNYIWRPGLIEGQSDTLLGKPVNIDDSMPDVAANSLSIGFGNWMRGYVITDRMGVRVLRDPFTAKPYIKFYTTKRVGGGIENFEAIKLMKFAVS